MADTFHQNYFYDGQIRRFVQQFIRMVSNFYVEFGSDTAEGATAIQRIPVMYGDPSRQAAQILRNNSENTMTSVPAMSVYITDLQYDRRRMQEPYHVSKMSLRSHRIDHETGQYDESKFDSFTVERAMPVPYLLTLNLDIWSSSTEQKLQIIEQIATLFNPSLEIQSTDNYIDWTSLSTVLLTQTRWDSRNVPSNNNDISISTMSFELPIWISPPAKIKKLGVIQKAVASVFDATGKLSSEIIDDVSYLSRRIVEPYGYSIIYSGNTITLVKNEAVAEINGELILGDELKNRINWKSLLDHYGELKDGTSEIRLTNIERTFESILYVSYNPQDATQLLIADRDIDSFPGNTIEGGIDGIIDPQNENIIKLMYDQNNTYSPGQNRPVARQGLPVRYLTLGRIGSVQNAESAEAWGGGQNRNFVAEPGDIIEYTPADGRWRVMFDASTENGVEYVTNLNTNIQYKWFNKQWTKSVEGLYREGEWRIVI